MGWRAFWSEIVIVVLGVVIALAANEAVQEWSWRNRVENAETRLRSDIAWAFLWGAEFYASQPCIDAQLAALSRNLLESGDTLKPQPVLTANTGVQYVVRMPNRPHRFPVWDMLVADGTATHFAPRRQAYLGRISIELALARDGRAEASVRSRNAYKSLINSGRLGLLKNRELARHIQTYYGNYDDLLDTQTNVFRIFRTEGVVHQQYPLGLSVFEPAPGIGHRGPRAGQSGIRRLPAQPARVGHPQLEPAAQQQPGNQGLAARHRQGAGRAVSDFRSSGG